MKKINIFVLMLLLTLGIVSTSSLLVEAASDTGTLKVTFVRTNESDRNITFHTWNRGNEEAFVVTKNDMIYTTEIKVGADAADDMGLIPVLDKGDGTPDWDNKLSYGACDLSIDISDIKGSGVKNVVLYEGAKDGEYLTSTVDTENYMMLLTYYSQSYEEHLGVHTWGGDWTVGDATGWGTPVEVFTTVGRAPDGTEIKAALLETANPDAGLLIYAGGDDNKKHPAHGNITLPEDAEAGKISMASCTNGEVYEGVVEFASFCEAAFKLRMLEFAVADNGMYTGTYAYNTQTVMVKLSTAIAVPKVKSAATETEEEVAYTATERAELVKGYFTISDDSTEDVIEIESVDYNTIADTVTEFVIQLKGSLDIKNTYTIEFDNDSKTADLALIMDTEAPKIDFIAGKDVFDVKWGVKYDMKNFPVYEAIDDRDGNITAKVYVPEGKGRLDTSVEGEYKVTLCVSDAWGNVTEKVITFKVAKAK